MQRLNRHAILLGVLLGIGAASGVTFAVAVSNDAPNAHDPIQPVSEIPDGGRPARVLGVDEVPGQERPVPRTQHNQGYIYVDATVGSSTQTFRLPTTREVISGPNGESIERVVILPTEDFLVATNTRG